MILKKFFAIIFSAIIIISCTNAPDSDKAKTSNAKTVDSSGADQSWKIDLAASSIEWVGTKVTGYHSGVVPLKSGEIRLLDGKVSGGKFIMDLANLTVSGPKGSDKASNDKLLGHLRSADFFDVQKNPEANFELTGVKDYSGSIKDTSSDVRQEDLNKYKVSDPTHTVNGNLTIKGITKNIEFPARITVAGDIVEAKAKFNINRKEWNIVYPGKPDDLIRDDIHLGIAIKANK